MKLNDLLNEKSSEWVILPATMALYGKRVVDILTAASEWKSSTIYVCSKTESSGKERILFVSSAGGGVGAKVGESYDAVHDQTRASKGRYKVLNIVHIKDGKIVSKENDVGIAAKASLSVFK